jgi:hypothetical protein
MMTQDLEAVATLLAPEAMRTGGKAPGGRAALMAWLRQRMLGMSNTVALEGVSLPVDRLEIYAFDDLGGEGRRARPLEMAPGDVLLRMPVQWPRGRGERLMNEVILLLLRPQGARWLIAGIQEEG